MLRPWDMFVLIVKLMLNLGLCVCLVYHIEKNTVLKGKGIGSTDKMGMKMCIRECLLHPGLCKSVNYEKIMLSCTMNSESNGTTSNPGTSYIDVGLVRDVENLVGGCKDMSCAPYEKCVETYANVRCVPTCPPGTFKTNGNSCAVCSPGTYTTVENSPQCTPCAPGTHQPQSGQTFCEACPPGTHAMTRISCTPCSPGTYGTNGTSCTPCPPGSYSSVSEAQNCKTCLPNTYQPDAGQTSCDDCRRSGSTYRGYKNVTGTGKTCQRWSSQYPHAHGHGGRPDAWENYCRDYDATYAWCYTIYTSSRWEKCTVYNCGY